MGDLLEFVRQELERRKGEIRLIADQSGIAYDTCLRIKNGEGDPGYSKVQILAIYLRGLEPSPKPSPRPASGPGAKSESDSAAPVSGAKASGAPTPAGGVRTGIEAVAQGMA